MSILKVCSIKFANLGSFNPRQSRPLALSTPPFSPVRWHWRDHAYFEIRLRGSEVKDIFSLNSVGYIYEVHSHGARVHTAIWLCPIVPVPERCGWWRRKNV